MAPTPYEFGWTYEIRVRDTALGDYHFDGRYLEEIVKRVREFLTQDFNTHTCLDDFCWCGACRTVYVGAHIRRYVNGDVSSIVFFVGGRCFYGYDHIKDPDSRDLADSVTHHVSTCFMEQGFVPDIDCVPVVNAFQN